MVLSCFKEKSFNCVCVFSACLIFKEQAQVQCYLGFLLSGVCSSENDLDSFLALSLHGVIFLLWSAGPSQCVLQPLCWGQQVLLGQKWFGCLVFG